MGELSGIFADNALRMRELGLAVLPANFKRPAVKGWNRWQEPPPPSTKTVEAWSRKFPGANVAILPGPSRLLVADVDDAGQAGEVERLLGPTPLHVHSNRGRHLYYRDAGGTSDLPANLVVLGLKCDLKRGASIVIAPPSLHQSGKRYGFDRCDWRALKELPAPDLQQLRKVLSAKAAPENERYTQGRRGLGINRIMCRHVAYCDDFEGLLDVARTANADFLPPLPDSEVVKRARQVWADFEAGKIEPWVGTTAVARTRAVEIKALAAAGRNGSDAFALLMLLRAEHGARCRRGETFFIMPHAMQRAQTLPGWHSKRIAAARDLLLKLGVVVRVRGSRNTAAGPLAAEYRLADRSTHGEGGAAGSLVTLSPDSGHGLPSTRTTRGRALP